MFKFWNLILEPILRAVDARKIIEIGVDEGDNTKQLLAWCAAHGAHLDYVDPEPRFDAEWASREYGAAGTFHRAPSLEALPKLDTPDVALIDGDHNWYTVYHELLAIAAKAEKSGAPFPLCLFHDVTWPYGRRDLYYVPERVPAQFRQLYAQKGITIDSREVVPKGGLNAQLFHAVVEGGPRNGVLTAIEDFVAESKVGTLQVIPLLYGLGILVPKRLAGHEKLQAELARCRSPEGLTALVELGERDRVDFHSWVHGEFARVEAERQRQAGKLAEAEARNAQLQAELERVAAERDHLRADLALIHASHSWRWTGLVRSAGALITGKSWNGNGRNGK